MHHRRPMEEIRGSVSLQRHNVFDLDDSFAHILDDVADAVGRNVELQLVSVEIDPGTGEGKRSRVAELEGWVGARGQSVVGADEGGEVYEVKFQVEQGFGEAGAILINSHHPFHFYLSSITLHYYDSSPTPRYQHFPCNSWIYNHRLYHNSPRIFFSNREYLPHQTPASLVQLRDAALAQLRGNGQGKRHRHERVYDYDVYNDLGDPDKDEELYSRTILGGSQEFPYPRRCRTGRARTFTDPLSERPVELPELVYVPRDERFRRIKKSDFLGSSFKSFAHGALTVLDRLIEGRKNFKHMHEIKDLYSKGIGINIDAIIPLTEEEKKEGFKDFFELIREIVDPSTQDTHIIKFPTPQVIKESSTAWSEDDEFARQMLAGLNPVVIQRLKEFPIVSNLDPAVYGPRTSSITAHHLEANMDGVSVAEALQQNRLYILDYHDAFLPYIERINALEGKAYASRTILFLTKQGTLQVLAIELSLPPTSKRSPKTLNRVFTPSQPSAKGQILWKLAKTHVSIIDAGYHQLISHWLRTHAVIEPFIIATYRQLSVMHPLHVLIVPHFKNTMNINAIARKILVNSYTGQFLIGGVIERTFSPGRYAMEMSSVVYRSWRFDEQSLPNDLIKRGMAVPDKTAKHGLKLMIEDYPYAVDGLEIWWAIKEWVTEYIGIFYKEDKELQRDEELRKWWTELVEEGHGDKKEGWIDVTKGREQLAEAITTVIWLASAHHAAVNFGQFVYAGFMPNKPTIGRKLIPDEDDEDSEDARLLNSDPDAFFLRSVSTRTQTIIVIAILEILSTHAADEEYLGQRTDSLFWTSNKLVLDAFERFKARLSQIEQSIVDRNKDPKLQNRRGAVRVPYTLLSPFSGEGLTGRGIPNSISI